MNKLFGINKPVIVGFLPYWLLDKTEGTYSDSITTLAYFGLSVDADGHIVALANDQEEDPRWTWFKSEKLQSLLKNAKNRNVALSLVVHSADEDVIDSLLDDPVASARTLASDALPLMKQHGFSDLNIDIERFGVASPDAQLAYTTFLRNVKEEIEKEDFGTLTVDIIASSLVRPMLTDPVAVGEIADYVVLMAYDYYYLGSYVSGPVAPLGGAPDTYEFDVPMALAEAVKKIPKEKLLLGIPLYGYQWETLSDRQGAPTIPGGGSTASSKRAIELKEACATCSATFSPVTQSPILTYMDGAVYNQIYYEDAASLAKKLNFARENGIGGVALWALGYEEVGQREKLKEFKRSVTMF